MKGMTLDKEIRNGIFLQPSFRMIGISICFLSVFILLLILMPYGNKEKSLFAAIVLAGGYSDFRRLVLLKSRKSIIRIGCENGRWWLQQRSGTIIQAGQITKSVVWSSLISLSFRPEQRLFRFSLLLLKDSTEDPESFRKLKVLLYQLRNQQDAG